ncbi:MAG: hypothetical protein AAF804_08285 [Bacteroidota bacterium]
MTPQESLALIQSVISEARERHEESGLVYIYWGAAGAIASLGHFYLQQQEAYSLIYVPWLLMPIAGFLSYFLFPYYRKDQRHSRNLIGVLVRNLWLVTAGNIMVLSFALPMELGKHLIPFLLILLGLSLALSGLAISSKVLFYAGLFANFVGLVGFWVPEGFHPLLLIGVNIISMIIPGIMLNRSYRERAHV